VRGLERIRGKKGLGIADEKMGIAEDRNGMITSDSKTKKNSQNEKEQ